MALTDYNSGKIINGEEAEIIDALNALLKNDTFDDILIEENIGMIDDYEITLGKERQEVIIDGIDKMTGNLRLRCKASTKEYTKEGITIIVKATGNVTKVIKPDNKEVIATNGKVEFDYLVNENGTYVFKAEDTEGTVVEKQIEIRTIDNVPPVLNAINVTAEALKIKISAEGSDSESGLEQFTYEINPPNGISEDKVSGEFNLEQTVEIISTLETTYTITVRAKDKVGNTSTEKTETVETIDALTIAQAKEEVNANTLEEYMGKRVIYNPDGGGIWRIFYYDGKDDGEGNGKFGDTGTLYLIRDYYKFTLPTNWASTSPSGKAMLLKMNPLASSKYNNFELTSGNIGVCAWLCNSTLWTQFKTSEAEFAIGSPSVEMFIEAYNAWKGNSENVLGYTVGGSGGHLISVNGSYYDNGWQTNSNTIKAGPGSIFIVPGKKWALCSISNWNYTGICVDSSLGKLCYDSGFPVGGIRPIVAIAP